MALLRARALTARAGLPVRKDGGVEAVENGIAQRPCDLVEDFRLGRLLAECAVKGEGAAHAERPAPRGQQPHRHVAQIVVQRDRPRLAVGRRGTHSHVGLERAARFAGSCGAGAAARRGRRRHGERARSRRRAHRRGDEREALCRHSSYHPRKGGKGGMMLFHHLPSVTTLLPAEPPISYQ